jgi:hypothetical protein
VEVPKTLDKLFEHTKCKSQFIAAALGPIEINLLLSGNNFF